jgi:hypothetical protein
MGRSHDPSGAPVFRRHRRDEHRTRGRTADRPWRLRFVAGALVALLVMVATSSLSWADDASTSRREATLRYGPGPHQVLDLHRPDPYASQDRGPCSSTCTPAAGSLVTGPGSRTW